MGKEDKNETTQERENVKKKSEMERKRAVGLTKNSNTPFHAFRTKRLTEICTEPESNMCATKSEQQESSN